MNFDNINSVIRLSRRQYGKGFDEQYDSVLSRLIVRPWDNWKGISPSQHNNDFNPDPPIFASKFALANNFNHILAVANEDGKVAIQDTFLKNGPNEESVPLEGDQCHFNAVFDIAWMPYHLKLITASGDHSARQWNITESKLVQVREFRGHTRSVKTAVFRKNDCSVFATGGRDGAILVWDLRSAANIGVNQKVDNLINSAHVGGPGTPQSSNRRRRNTTPKQPPNVGNCSITGLAFQDDYTLISCGPGDGIIKVWDLRRCYTTLKREPLPKHSLPYAGRSTLKGFSNLIVDSTGSKLYANCMDNHIYCYNICTYQKDPVMVYSGLKSSTFYIKACLSPDDKYLLSGSSDEKAFIWNVKSPTPLVELTGHNYEVTCVAWSQHQNNLDGGNMCLVTCSDDANHKIWRIGPETLDMDEKRMLKGRADVIKDYFGQNKDVKRQALAKMQLKMLESTPRSLKRLVELNEKTPTTSTKKDTQNIPPNSSDSSCSKKRTFSEMIEWDDDADPKLGGSDLKRPNLETKGRRLFSPQAGTSNEFQSLSTILEELHSPPNNNTNFQNLSPTKKSNLLKKQLNIIRSPEMSKVYPHSPMQALRFPVSPHIARAICNSPTTNLPNYAIDGEAPHLGPQMSPYKKPQKKENLDWLTKMRKQKLNKLDKSGSTRNGEEELKVEQFNRSEEDVDKLKSIENKAEVQDEHIKVTSSKKKSDNTLLRFFSVKSVTKSGPASEPEKVPGGSSL